MKRIIRRENRKALRGLMIVAITLVLLIPAAASTAAEWYVSSDLGSDENTGTQESPFQTINRAVESLSDGDTIVVAPGFYDENVVLEGNDISLVRTDYKEFDPNSTEASDHAQVNHKEGEGDSIPSPLLLIRNSRNVTIAGMSLFSSGVTIELDQVDRCQIINSRLVSWDEIELIKISRSNEIMIEENSISPGTHDRVDSSCIVVDDESHDVFISENEFLSIYPSTKDQWIMLIKAIGFLGLMVGLI